VPTALAGLSWTGFRNSDFVIVGARLGTLDAGYYWRGYQLGLEYQRKIGSAVHQIAFPVYSRASSREEMLELRRRVVRVVCAVLIPGLALLCVLAPLLVPWLFGPTWEPAVVPTQILALAGIVTVPGDMTGAIVLAVGRARGWLAYHLAFFATYAGAIYVASGYGLTAVCVAVVAVQAASTLACYAGLMRGLVDRPLACLWEDVYPAAAAAIALAATATPAAWTLSDWEAPVFVTLPVAGGLGGLASLVALRVVSPDAWSDVRKLGSRALRGRSVRGTQGTSVAGVQSG
jgi:O-antigen/teichoic acid export membrane protein